MEVDDSEAGVIHCFSLLAFLIVSHTLYEDATG